MRNKRQYAIILIAAVIAVIAMLVRKPIEYRTTSGVVWHTTYNITYESDKNLDDSIILVTNRIDYSASMYNPLSTLSRINNNSTDIADTTVALLLKKSKLIHLATDGAFDPTVAPLVKLWKTQDNGAQLPSEAQIDSVMQFVGLDKVSIDSTNRIHKADSRIQIDFSAIAKGHGCDEVARMLARNGVENYIVEIGGEIVAHGRNQHGKPWRVSVDTPVEENAEVSHSPAEVYELDGQAMATSGNYRNYKVVNGQKVAHIIDPKTGYSVQSDLLSVTVIAPTCIEADAYATAMMAMGLEKSQQFAFAHTKRLTVLLIYADENGVMRLWETPRIDLAH